MSVLLPLTIETSGVLLSSAQSVTVQNGGDQQRHDSTETLEDINTQSSEYIFSNHAGYTSRQSSDTFR